jgi:hypothetical protein
MGSSTEAYRWRHAARQQRDRRHHRWLPRVRPTLSDSSRSRRCSWRHHASFLAEHERALLRAGPARPRSRARLRLLLAQPRREAAGTSRERLVAAHRRPNRESPGGRLRRCAGYAPARGSNEDHPVQKSKLLAAQHVFRRRSSVWLRRFRWCEAVCRAGEKRRERPGPGSPPAAAGQDAGTPTSTVTLWVPAQAACPASRARATVRATVQPARTGELPGRASGRSANRTATTAVPRATDKHSQLWR